jgi:hypothetical protein
VRIRSIKPEFWTSEDVAVLDWPTRLLFIGLWSYVDDNGVGRDNPKLIKADLFPLEDDPRETLATVSRGLQALCGGGQIDRYIVDGKPYLYVNAWESHQRIDRPNKARYPLPTCGNAHPRDTLASVSRHPREDSATGTGEQGNRGTGEQGIPPKAGGGEVAAELALLDEAPTAQTLVGEWIEHCTDRPPGRVVGQVAKELKSLLEEGVDPGRIRRALAEWNRKGLHPSTLPSVVHEIANRVPMARGQQATDDLFDAAMHRAIERDRTAG